MSRNQRSGAALSRVGRTLAIAVIAGASVVGFAGPLEAKARNQVEGTFSGRQTLGFFDPRCPRTQPTYFTNVSDFTFDLTRGPDWSYHADACSYITPEVVDDPETIPVEQAEPSEVTTAGGFTIGAPGGTITGSFTITRGTVLSPVELLGVEQTLDITGGTGRFKRATGTCELTGFVTSPLVFEGLVARTDYAGSFTCDVSRSARR